MSIAVFPMHRGRWDSKTIRSMKFFSNADTVKLWTGEANTTMSAQCIESWTAFSAGKYPVVPSPSVITSRRPSRPESRPTLIDAGFVLQ